MRIKKIDVIIPAYNAHDTIAKTISSINIQTISHLLKVTIVNDGGKDYSEIINFFKRTLDIQEIYKENTGPSLTRQYGIDNTNNDYIVFIDSDDILMNAFALERSYKTIDSNIHIVEINTPFYEEGIDRTYDLKKENNIWLFGNMYRRSFLKQNNIRFPQSNSNEDLIFNQEVQMVAAKEFKTIVYASEESYIWKWNEKSITRKEFAKYGDFISKYELIKENKKLLKRYDIKYAEPYLWKSLWDYFVFWDEALFNTNVSYEETNKMLKVIIEFYKEFENYFRLFSKVTVEEFYEERVKELGMITRKTFTEFIEILEKNSRRT